LQLGALDLPAQDSHLVPQHDQFDVLGPAVAGDLGQHLQGLPQQPVFQRPVGRGGYAGWRAGL
jgi:hypothetical protein